MRASSYSQTTTSRSSSAAQLNLGLQSAGPLFANYALADKGGHVSREFQDFAYRLAVALDDLPHKSLYMRLAKRENRALLEQAWSFVSDAPQVKSKARLFMWKLKQLRQTIGQEKAKTS